MPQPSLSKQLFDKAQQVLKSRSKPQKVVNEPKPLCGLLTCGECGRSITAEVNKGHTYYRCTKKNVVCSQPYIRGEILAEQLSDTLKDFALPDGMAAELYKLADNDEQEAARSPMRENQAVQKEIDGISEKLQRLFDAYLEEDIERNVYRSEKMKLLSRKKSLEERLSGSSRGYMTWLEPLRDWIKNAEDIGETAVSSNLPLQKSVAQKLFGSNLFLKNRRVEFVPTEPYASLREARKNFDGVNLVSCSVPEEGVEPS